MKKVLLLSVFLLVIPSTAQAFPVERHYEVVGDRLTVPAWPVQCIHDWCEEQPMILDTNVSIRLTSEEDLAHVSLGMHNPSSGNNSFTDYDTTTGTELGTGSGCEGDLTTFDAQAGTGIQSAAAPYDGVFAPVPPPGIRLYPGQDYPQDYLDWVAEYNASLHPSINIGRWEAGQYRIWAIDGTFENPPVTVSCLKLDFVVDAPVYLDSGAKPVAVAGVKRIRWTHWGSAAAKGIGRYKGRTVSLQATSIRDCGKSVKYMRLRVGKRTFKKSC